MARVFVILDQQHRDRFTGEMTSKFDFSSAEDYGELVFVLAPNSNPRDPKANEELWEALRTYTEADYLLPVGSPVLIMLMGAYAALSEANVSKLTILDWERDRFNRNQGLYLPVVVDLMT